MTVSMGIRDLETERYEVVPIATHEVFSAWWLPACEQLGLALVPRFHDGMLSEVARDDIPQIIAELLRLRAWACSTPERRFMVDRIDGILRAFRDNDPARCAYDFG